MPCCWQGLLEYARIPPAVNQIEVHPYMRNDYNIKFCSSKVHFVSRQPLPLHGEGACDPGTLPSAHPKCWLVLYFWWWCSGRVSM